MAPITTQKVNAILSKHFQKATADKPGFTVGKFMGSVDCIIVGHEPQGAPHLVSAYAEVLKAARVRVEAGSFAIICHGIED